MSKQKNLEKIIKFKGHWEGGYTIDDDGYDSGNFSMSINLNPNGTFSGKTRDRHGIAEVKGKLEGDSIKFIKTYVNGNGIFGYRGKKSKEGDFKGKWYEKNHWHGRPPEYDFSLKFA